MFCKSWNRANIVPVCKKNDNAITDNYTPVSLRSCTGKLFERSVFNMYCNSLRDTNAISLNNLGLFLVIQLYISWYTCITYLLKLLINKKLYASYFCDVSKAFDRVWYAGLLAKVNKVGITGGLLRWFKDFLSKRQQWVVINGQSSEWDNILAGYVMGLSLGPWCF